MSLLDLDAIRIANPLPAVVGASVKLHRAGNEWKACCPFHADRSPSFTIFDGGQRFHCFGCGAGGDVLDYLQLAHSVDLREAAAMLEAGSVPVVVQRSLPPEPERDTIGEARAIWRSAFPAAGTPAGTYLRARGIHTAIPESIRFADLPYGRGGKPLPCLVAVIAGPDNKIAGIQRTYLRPDGAGKADVPAPKLSLGRIRGGAIRLTAAAAELIVTGGLEDALTLQQELGGAVWAATGEGNIASLQLPERVRSVVIGADADASGERFAQEAAEAFSLQERRVRIVRPEPPHKDFNAWLRGVLA